MADQEKGAEALGSPPPIKVRIESLSDLVFGLALSIGSIILVGNVPSSGGALAGNVLFFGFGFAIIILTWFGYSRTTAVLPPEVPYSLITNVLLLFVVALEPYLFYVLISAQTVAMADASSIAYGLDVGGMFIIQGALAYLVVKEYAVDRLSGKSLHPAVISRFSRISRANFIVGAIFVASALPIFWVATPIGYLRFYMWSSSAALLVPIFAARRRTRKSRATRATGSDGLPLSESG